jgi:sigma-B regulation protein RsbU (phosphoserine phosphatase)
MANQPSPLFAAPGNWRERLAVIVDTMREMSRQTDPQQMVRAYVARMAQVIQRDRFMTLSRRENDYPAIVITRDSERQTEINPWTQRDRLPVVRGGLLAELIYGDEPRIIDELEVPADDPGAAYFAGQRSLMAIPLYDRGLALNMVIFMRKKSHGFTPEELPEYVWMSNLFGRATQNLVLSTELRRAYEAIDQELKAVASIQRSLLPAELPHIPTLDLAAYYQTSRRAGGDYYDLFPLAQGRWGILIADVSGHGTPAAVLMAITHTLAHTYPEAPYPPSRLLTRLNAQLTQYYTHGSGTFVTAFYGIYDPQTRQLTYARAGHNPPRLKRCADGTLVVLDRAAGLPLGIVETEQYPEAVCDLQVGDQIVFYTDGITEAANRAGEMFGPSRLDQVLKDCGLTAAGLVQAVVEAVERFMDGRPADDDRTVLIAKVK